MNSRRLPLDVVIQTSTISLVFAASLTFGLSATWAATTYYVSQSSGSDAGDGQSPAAAWKTLAKASQPSYAPGDSILLKRGDTWNEELHPTGEGTAADPITIAAYGSGPRPLIDRQNDGSRTSNMHLPCIHLKNTGGYKIQGIEFARFGRGVFADLDQGVYNKDYLWVEDCDFRDSQYFLDEAYTVSPPDYNRYIWNSGVDVRVAGFHDKSTATYFSNITVRNCQFYRVGVAVNTWSGHEWDFEANDIWTFRNVRVIGCRAMNGRQWQFAIRSTLGGGIFDSVVNEVAHDNYRYSAGVAGTMLVRCKDMDVEHCEFGYIYVGNNSGDGETFDLECGCTDIRFKNCNFHDTAGPGFVAAVGSSSHQPNVGITFDNCVFNCKTGRIPSSPSPFVEIWHGNIMNRLTFSNTRFYLADGEPVTSLFEGLTFNNCPINQTSKPPSGSNLCIGATASASSAASGGEASKAIDGKTDTAWLATGASAGEWLQADFGSARTINQFIVKEHPLSAINRYRLQYWDGATSSWRDSFNGLRIGPALRACVVPITTRKVRLYVLDSAVPAVTANDDDPKATYRGAWSIYNETGYYRGDVHTSKTAGDCVEYAFSGRDITVVGTRSTNRGMADVFLDGEFQATVNTYGSPTHQYEIFSKTGLSSGKHTIKIVVKGTKDSSSNDAWIDIDAFRHSSDTLVSPPRISEFEAYLDTAKDPFDPFSLPPGLVNDSHDHVSYTGRWETYPSAAEIGGDEHYSNEQGASCQVTFSGTGITWIGVKNLDGGEAKVYLDGTLQATVDTYSASRVSRQELFARAGLPKGQHTIKVVVKGAGNPASKDCHVIVDAFKVEN